MIMSTQSHVVRAHAPDLIVVVVQSVRTRISSILERVLAHRLARAKHEVRAALTSLSAERPTEHRWSLKKIDRLKSG